jgi:hypothetical protein
MVNLLLTKKTNLLGKNFNKKFSSPNGLFFGWFPSVVGLAIPVELMVTSTKPCAVINTNLFVC